MVIEVIIHLYLIFKKVEFMKILLLIPRMNNGGAERVMSHIANELCENANVKLLTFVGNTSFYKLNKKVYYKSLDFKLNTKNKFTRYISMMKNFMLAVNLTKKEVKEFKPDIIISFLFEADLIMYLIRKYLKESNIKWITSERNDPFNRTFIRKFLEKKIYKECDVFVCQGKKVYDYYSFLQEKYIIPNPLYTSNLVDTVCEADAFKICAVGRLMPQKNFSMLINAFNQAKGKLPNNASLTIYGEGILRGQLEQQIKNLGLTEQVFLPGASHNIFEDIRDSAIFIMSSDFEGFPNALLEAMALGLPVISTDFPTGIAKELISDLNGIVVPCGDVERMKQAIIILANDKEKREFMRKRNLYVREKYDIENVIKLWLDLIYSLHREDNINICQKVK